MAKRRKKVKAKRPATSRSSRIRTPQKAKQNVRKPATPTPAKRGGIRKKSSNSLPAKQRTKPAKRDSRNPKSASRGGRGNPRTQRASVRSRARETNTGRSRTGGRNNQRIANLKRSLREERARNKAALDKANKRAAVQEEKIRKRDQILRELTRTPKEGRQHKFTKTFTGKDGTVWTATDVPDQPIRPRGEAGKEDEDHDALPKKYQDDEGGIKEYTGEHWDEIDFNDFDYDDIYDDVGEEESDDQYAGGEK